MRFPWYLQDQVLRVILFLAVSAGMTVGLVIPFLTITARDRGVSLTAIGVMASSYLVAQVVLQLPMGALSDRVGRQAPIVAGLLIEALATAGFAFADSATAFILLRAGQGVGFSFLYPAFRALIADTTAANRRGQAYAVVAAAFSGGLLFGPPVGGILASGIGASTLFVAAGALEVLIAIWALFYLGRIIPEKRREVAQERVPFRALLVKPLLGAFLLAFAAQFQIGLFSGIWSIFLEDLGASDFEIGLSFSTYSIAFMALAPLGGRLADRGHRWRRLLIANLCFASVVSVYGLVAAVWAVLLLGLVEGAIVAVAQPALDAYLASVADPRIQGRIQGAFATAGMTGAAISALLGSILYGIDPAVPFIAGGVVLALLTLISVYIIRGVEMSNEVRPVTVSDSMAVVSQSPASADDIVAGS